MATVSGTWLFNDSIEPPYDQKYAEVKFHYDRTECEAIGFSSGVGLYYKLRGGGLYVVCDKDGVWSSETVKKITFAHEQTVSDDYFYEWFSANALQVVGEKFTIKGKWKLKETITPLENRAPTKYTTVYYVKYTYLWYGNVKTQTAITQYDEYTHNDNGDDVLSRSLLVFAPQWGLYPYDFLTDTWTTLTGFDRVIDFGETEQTIDRKMYSWIMENATPVGAEITYNGVTASVEVGKNVTLHCEGKKMKSDIVMTFGSNGSITYNGAQTGVKNGQTATIYCEGKKMKSDLVVSL